MVEDSSFAVAVPNEAALPQLVADFAAALEPGDCVSLSGDLGTGKTTFARAVIRRLAGDSKLEVPSPTFTLLQIYDLPRFALVHADFYRINDPDDLIQTGFGDLPPQAVVLVEWPERAPGALPTDRWDVALELNTSEGSDFRNVRITGMGAFGARVPRLVARRRFLNDSGFPDAVCERLAGDASTRSYQKFQSGSRSLILMDAPRRPDGPPVRDGKPYS